MKQRKLTKQQKGFLWSYNHSDSVTLESLYRTSPSSAKIRAAQYCLADYEEHNGYHMRFMRGGCFFFQFAYKYRDNTDYTVHLRYHTAYNVYDFIIATLDENGNEVSIDE